MLAYYFKQSPGSPEILQRQLLYPVQSKQLSSVFNFVISEIKGDPMVLDSRWEVERKISLVARTKLALSGSGSALGDLREMLGQMGFDLKIPDMTQINAALESLQQERLGLTRGDLTFAKLPENYNLSSSPVTIRMDGTNYVLEIMPINRKPNLNLIEEKPLSRYLQLLGMKETESDRLAQVIVDYRDTDTNALGGNTEGPFQTDVRFTTKARNNLIKHFEELAYLPGIDPAMISFLRQNFQLYGHGPLVNYKYVTPQVLAALTDLQPELVSQAIEFERRKTDPLYNQTLENLLGSDAANIWLNMVTDTIDSEDPVTLALKGNEITINAVYDLKTKQMLDVYTD